MTELPTKYPWLEIVRFHKDFVQFHEKAPEFIDKGLLKFMLKVRCRRRNMQELQDIRVPDEFIR